MAFLIKNNKTGEFLYYNGALIGGGYHFKAGKHGATIFDKQKKNRVLKYLRENGHDVRAKVVKLK